MSEAETEIPPTSSHHTGQSEKKTGESGGTQDGSLPTGTVIPGRGMPETLFSLPLV